MTTLDSALVYRTRNKRVTIWEQRPGEFRVFTVRVEPGDGPPRPRAVTADIAISAESLLCLCHAAGWTGLGPNAAAWIWAGASAKRHLPERRAFRFGGRE
jgi:hypothetical protein